LGHFNRAAAFVKTFKPMKKLTKHGTFEHLPRHRHAEGYVALVLTGGYVEAGDRGRFHVAAGDAVIHGPYESHQNRFSQGGATVINLPLADKFLATVGCVDDPDSVVRLAERDPRHAAHLLATMFRPLARHAEDWPDLLAASLASSADISLTAWADFFGIAPQSLSRGFRRVYGVSPKTYRADQRTLRAVRALPQWCGTLAQFAAEMGFADQSHMIRSVRTLTGRPPNRIRVQFIQGG
jgi:AraC-like DNA-binding protein